MFTEWTIKKHSVIVTANHMDIVCIKLNEIVKDSEVGTLSFDPTTEKVDVACDSKTIVNDIWTF